MSHEDSVLVTAAADTTSLEEMLETPSEDTAATVFSISATADGSDSIVEDAWISFEEGMALRSLIEGCGDEKLGLKVLK